MLDKDQRATYRKDGFLVITSYFTRAQIDCLAEELVALEKQDRSGRIVERSGEPNSIYITEEEPALFAFTKQPRLTACAQDLLDGPVYLHQAKLNSKVAFRGSAVEWHRDFDFWSRLDGMPDSAALTVAVFIDAVDENNAPLLLIPGSHTSLAPAASACRAPNNTGGEADLANVGSWTGAVRAGESTVVGDLKYVADTRHVVEPIVALKGGIGTVVFFHSNLIHGSGCNMSPRGRRMLFCSFNRISNSLQPVHNPRPSYIANRDFTPLLAEGHEVP